MRFQLLGPVDVEIGRSHPALGGPRQRALLADLALHAGNSVLTSTLVDDLWGDNPPTSAVHTVEAYASRLRIALHRTGERPVLVTTGRGYLLEVEAQQVDALLFGELSARGRVELGNSDLKLAETQLSSALALWRGPALADVRSSAFTSVAVRTLENDRAVALEALVDVRMRMGRHRDVVSELEQAIAADPFRERFYAQLMLAFYRSGRQADALATFHRARKLFAVELGIQPGRELRELEEAILCQSPELDLSNDGHPNPDRKSVGSSSALTADEHDRGFVQTIDISAGSPQEAMDPSPRRRRHRSWAGAIVVALVLIAFFVGPPTSSSTAVAVSTVGVTEVTTARDHDAATVSLPSEPDSASFGDGSLWVTSPEAHALYRIDPRSRATDTIAVGAGAGALAVTGTDVWVANSLDGTVSRVSSATNAVVQTVRVGPEPTGVAVGDGEVWVSDAAASTLSAIDAATGNTTFTQALSSPPFAVSFGAGSLWLTDPSANAVTRVGPDGGVGVQIPVGGGPDAVAFGLGSVWVANGLDSTVSRIDPTTDSVIATIQVGDSPDSLAVAGDAVWVGNRSSSTLTRLDASTDSRVETVVLRASPVALSVVGSRLWAATRPALGDQSAGGVLRVELSGAPDSIDPAQGFPYLPFQFFEGSYDSLVTYEQVGGNAGLQLVPNLALTMPSITAGGTVYSFVLRPGLRYSDGTMVRPEDFRYAIERVMELNPAAAGFMTRIVGASSCAGGSACNLDRGITVSDSADSVTFHLTAPDADFLHKLAFQFTAPVPAYVPTPDDDDPVPSTGPYMVAKYLPGGQTVDFIRNPYFKEWSAAAEPAGSADQIIWRFGASVPSEVAAIEADQADWMDDYVPDLAGLLAQRPSQVHVNPDFDIDYAAFNTTVAPFNDVRVRQAFSLAADRRTLVDELGGPSAATPTCQILPPGIPGYVAYCPFTVDPSTSGAWVGPDLTAARKLVAASGTEGMRVTVMSQSYEQATGAFMVSVLRELGYQASMTTLPAYLGDGSNDSRQQVQATDGSWVADYPAPSDFLDLFFRCSASQIADPAATRNGSFFCDPAIDAQLNAADQQATTDPAQAVLTWAAVDHEVTSEAPWVPLVSENWVDFLSTRVAHYQYNPAIGILLDQLTIRHG